MIKCKHLTSHECTLTTIITRMESALVYIIMFHSFCWEGMGKMLRDFSLLGNWVLFPLLLLLPTWSILTPPLLSYTLVYYPFSTFPLQIFLPIFSLIVNCISSKWYIKPLTFEVSKNIDYTLFIFVFSVTWINGW